MTRNIEQVIKDYKENGLDEDLKILKSCKANYDELVLALMRRFGRTQEEPTSFLKSYILKSTAPDNEPKIYWGIDSLGGTCLTREYAHWWHSHLADVLQELQELTNP